MPPERKRPFSFSTQPTGSEEAVKRPSHPKKQRTEAPTPVRSGRPLEATQTPPGAPGRKSGQLPKHNKGVNGSLGSGEKKPPKKHITWARGENTVRYVDAPPKSESEKYWFDRQCVRVLKPLYFTVDSADEPVTVDVSEEGAMKLNIMSAPTRSKKQLAEAAAKKLGGLGFGKLSGGPRSTLEICCDDVGFDLEEWAMKSFGGQMTSPPSRGRKQEAKDRWIAIGSAPLGTTVQLGASLVSGSYRLRCVGAGPIVVGAEVAETIEKLM